MDADRIATLIQLAASPNGLTEARRQAAVALGVSDQTISIPNGCAATLSALLQMSAINIPMTLGAGKLAQRLGGPGPCRNWAHVATGSQQPGDVGVTFDNTNPPGADHVYLVLQRVDADLMVIADNQDKVPHQRAASGAGGKTPTDYFLRAGAADSLVLSAGLGAGLTQPDTLSPGTVAKIVAAAQASPLNAYDWPDRGYPAAGYIDAMAVAFGGLYLRLLTEDPFALEMAKPGDDPALDALAWYHNEFLALGLGPANTAADRLHRLFMLMIGLGMRESSGSHCVGRDSSANNTTADTAEAGLFQTSWNVRSASNLLPLVFQKYQGRTDLSDYFTERCKPTDLEDHGQGNGREFQRLSKACPAFAIEFAAIGLRNRRSHWGPINSHKAEARREAADLLSSVKPIVDAALPSLGLH